MPDRRTDLLVLLKQHNQPYSRKTEEKDASKQHNQPDSRGAEKEVPRTRKPEALKKSSQSKSDGPKQPAVLKQRIDGRRSAGEEIPHDLPEVWKQQLSVVNELIGLGLAEAEAFKIDDVARIMSIVGQQQEVIDRMQALERRLAEVKDPVPSCLIEQVKKLQQINETNRLLARMALSFNRMMQKALVTAATGGSYDENGKLSAFPGSLGRLYASA